MKRYTCSRFENFLTRRKNRVFFLLFCAVSVSIPFSSMANDVEDSVTLLQKAGALCVKDINDKYNSQAKTYPSQVRLTSLLYKSETKTCSGNNCYSTSVIKGIPYIEVTEDGSKPGSLWWACMHKKGFN